MSDSMQPALRKDLLTRRARLEAAVESLHPHDELQRLISEVDAALARLDDGTYGLCEECREPIEAERLWADPVVRFCLDHLPPGQRAALEDDLELAARIQEGLLPAPGLFLAGWETAYHYEAARIVSGDYCDLLGNERGLHFVLGDVSGKGVSAAMLMVHLQATIRSLLAQDLPLAQIMARASRIFCESTRSNLFATLACGRAGPDGEVTISSGGHDPIVVARHGGVDLIGATGIPLGLFCDAQFGTRSVRLKPGDVMLVYSDGLSEAVDPAENEYGLDRLATAVSAHRGLGARELLAACLEDLRSFRAGAPLRDDLTLLVLRRATPA